MTVEKNRKFFLFFRRGSTESGAIAAAGLSSEWKVAGGFRGERDQEPEAGRDFLNRMGRGDCHIKQRAFNLAGGLGAVTGTDGGGAAAMMDRAGAGRPTS